MNELFDIESLAADEQVAGRPVPSAESVPVVYDGRTSLDVRQILQPRTITYAGYRLSKIHRAMLVHIREELQAYISQSMDDIDMSKLIRVPLFVSHYPVFRRNGSAFMRSVMKMMTDKGNFVYFEWRFSMEKHRDLFLWMQKGVKGSSRIVMPKDNALIQEFSAIIVHAVRCDNDPGKILVDINPSVLPFLLYYGPGVGGTVFDRDISLSLESSYSSRLYELFCDWSSVGGSKVLSLDDLKKLLCIPSKYLLNDIRVKVLDVAKADLEAVNCPITFDYELRYNSEFGPVTGSRGRYPANCVVFTFNRKEFVDWSELSRKQILVMLQGIADSECMHLCEPLARQIVRNSQDGKVKSKFYYYDKKVSVGKMSALEYKNTMLKIVREITGVDLRSGRHIRNSARAKRRMESSDNEPRLLFDQL